MPLNSSTQLSFCFPHSAQDRSKQDNRKSINGDMRPLQLLHSSFRTTDTVRSLASIFNCILDLSHRTIQLIPGWDKYLFHGHHFLPTARVYIPLSSNRPRHSALAQADRLKKHQVHETQRHRRQHAHPHGKVAQQHMFNSGLVR